MRWVDKLERKFGRFTIPNIMLYLILLYVLGYFILETNPMFYFEYLCLDAQAILHGQVWRIITFLMYPPYNNLFMMLLLSYFYFLMGRLMEQMMGVFRFNLYLITGVLGHVLAALVIYLFSGQVVFLTASQLYLSMLLAVSVTVPDMQFYILYGLLPIKAKYLGLIYGAVLAYDMIRGNWVTRVTILLSLLNFVIYFFLIRRPVSGAKQVKRKVVYEMKAKAPTVGSRHRCAVCGRTEKDDPNLEFRYCSKCEGGLEYCKEHLYTHVHVSKEGGSHEKN